MTSLFGVVDGGGEERYKQKSYKSDIWWGHAGSGDMIYAHG